MSTGTATIINICNHELHIGDFVRVRYTTGKTMKNGEIWGTVVELWSYENDHHLQARVDSGWCFHDHDEILIHKKAE
jgi:hypothetical protein